MKTRKFYPKVSDLSLNQLGVLFGTCHYFDGTLTYYDDEGNLQHYPVYGPATTGFNGTELAKYWKAKFGEKRLVKPLNLTPWSTEDEFDDAIADYDVKIMPLFHYWFESHKYKYLKLLQTMYFDYDPICNYDMTENSQDSRGDEVFTHTPVAKSGLDFSIVSNSPALSGTTDENIGVSTWDDPNAVSKSQVDGANPITNTHKTTTYDSTALRNESQDTQSGGTTSYTTPSASVKKYNSEEYTDTKSLDGLNTHSLTRKGNIGVMTTQDMIKSEREIADFNIIDMMFEELNHDVLLAIWH